MATYSAKKGEVERSWYIIDAENKVLGKVATKIAVILRGKHKPVFTPHVDTGDFVVVINAKKVHLTGKKLANKMYYRHTGYPGGLKSMSAEEMLKKKPVNIIKLAVRGMLPKNKLGRKQLTKLKVYSGSDHPHKAQTPKELKD
ncbi:MAG: 50S ribosomal protein L13 [Deltaproteobacteria bacterium]|jgi:large subunit ribosomal protein L13|nr:50S ribosomal protein L13 [Deltaproteobacteria bacterium]MBW2184031.1 50S ribosomal protein L13 [Deltaproteobacteria bacterium]